MSSKNFDDISNLKNKALIEFDEKLASYLNFYWEPRYQTFSVPVKEYSVEQIVYAVCQKAEEVDMIFYSSKGQELTFILTGLPEGFDVTALLEGMQNKGIQTYKTEAERLTAKLKEEYDSIADSLTGQISLRKFIDMLVKNYQEELKYIRDTELEWQYILRKNHAVKIKKVQLVDFIDGVLTFKIDTEEDQFSFFVPSDFERTTVKRQPSYFRNSDKVKIQENEKALVLFSVLIDKIQSFYEHCMGKMKIYSIMKNHTLPKTIPYQEYQLEISVQEKMQRISNLSLAIKYQGIVIVRVEFYFAIDREGKNLLKRTKNQIFTLLQSISPYHNYNVITSNIMLNAYLRKNMVVLLEKILIDSSVCDFL